MSPLLPSMRSQITSAALGLGALVLVLIVLSISLLSAQAVAARQRRLNHVLSEIALGNYFAWGQASAWWPSLTAEERMLVHVTCLDYVRSRRDLQAKGNSWPPAPTASELSGGAVLAWCGWLPSGLRYGRFCYPAFDSVPVEFWSQLLEPMRW